MAFRNKRKDEEHLAPALEEKKILDVDASMQGSMVFRDPVNLRINGKFEGTLDTKGSLTIGEKAEVQANIIGEDIIIAGKVLGNVTSSNSLALTATAHLEGDIRTPSLSIAQGAVFQGKCQMESRKDQRVSSATMQQAVMSVEELAKYLEVDSASVLDWAKNGRIPAQKEGSSWRFDRNKIDIWIASEKIK
ncbi:MAG: polymer-forming cytoskeletal protein [Candidatus Omnitrophica bacterium]|nr:polymer-forming cytoskeletal protein [Candidatus Omnitrophota bacterium]